MFLKVTDIHMPEGEISDQVSRAGVKIGVDLAQGIRKPDLQFLGAFGDDVELRTQRSYVNVSAHALFLKLSIAHEGGRRTYGKHVCERGRRLVR